MTENAADYPEDRMLHILGIPADLIPRINRYNNEHRRNKINVTAICIKALENALKGTSGGVDQW